MAEVYQINVSPRALEKLEEIVLYVQENELTVIVVEINHEKEDLEKLKGVFT